MLKELELDRRFRRYISKQARSITLREAAEVQSSHDRYIFSGAQPTSGSSLVMPYQPSSPMQLHRRMLGHREPSQRAEQPRGQRVLQPPRDAHRPAAAVVDVPSRAKEGVGLRQAVAVLVLAAEQQHGVTSFGCST